MITWISNMAMTSDHLNVSSHYAGETEKLECKIF